MGDLKVILCSHFPLPYQGIGSWTTMYNYYLKGDHAIDYILCPTSHSRWISNKYLRVKDGLLFKIQKKMGLKRKYEPYFLSIKDYLRKNNTHIILHIIDNAGFANDLIKFINKNNLGDRCYFQFSYHGFLPYFNLEKGPAFVNGIDEFIFLTQLSKEKYRERYPSANFHSSVLHNGINKELFKPRNDTSFNKTTRENIKNRKCIYLWLSNDRPKKGLSFLLEIWKSFHKEYEETELWVVGSDRVIDDLGVKSFNKLPNSELPKFYQEADVYLFPTQCQEGFGLSLIEALSCGCYCIASKVGGIPEVLREGELGVLVSPYNDKKKWYEEMEKAYFKFADNNLEENFTLPRNMYCLENWSQNLSTIIENAKERIIQQY